MHVEHINPIDDDDPGNLCLSCSSCNLSKGKATTGHDPETGEDVKLFNPRTQSWDEHFIWVDEGRTIRGITPTGRVTITRLKMNQQRIIRARQNWITAGTHPPE
jgi:hypothetical protein